MTETRRSTYRSLECSARLDGSRCTLPARHGGYHRTSYTDTTGRERQRSWKDSWT